MKPMISGRPLKYLLKRQKIDCRLRLYTAIVYPDVCSTILNLRSVTRRPLKNLRIGHF